jgi:hypothetical protein
MNDKIFETVYSGGTNDKFKTFQAVPGGQRRPIYFLAGGYTSSEYRLATDAEAYAQCAGRRLMYHCPCQNCVKYVKPKGYSPWL